MRRAKNFWYVILVLFSAVILTLSILHVFMLRPFGFILLQSSYLFSLIAFSLPLIFILYPARKSDENKVPWYDILLFLVSFGIVLFFSIMGGEITDRGWELQAPLFMTILSIVLWFLILESVRRTSGIVLLTVCAVFSFFPLYTEYLPIFLRGRGFSFFDTAAYHMMSNASILGIPTQALGDILVGFLVFGVALQGTGGGDAFFGIAMAVMGRFRGGPAKVSVLSSSLYGTMSGSVISNVLVDGPFTIPAMVKAGYKPHYAGAIECVTSTGGALMPPIMGAVAFVMANFLNVPFSKVIIIATVPAILYYLALFFQIDGYAAKRGLKGVPISELPRLKDMILRYWYFLAALVALLFFVFVHEPTAPFYSMLVLLLCAMVRKDTRLSVKSFFQMVADSGKVIAEIVTILAAVGFVVGSLSMTGVGPALSRELVAMAGDNGIYLLFMGAIASAVLGMGMTATACYIFLAITMAPALVMMGYNVMAVHLFLLYWGLVSFITPPVALASIAAASIAGTNSLKLGFTAMRLGSVIYFVPFFFVLNPALILIGSPVNIVLSVLTAILGVFFIANSLEGYILGFGKISGVIRILTGGAGFLLCAPSRKTEIIGVILIVIGLTYVYFKSKRDERKVVIQAKSL